MSLHNGGEKVDKVRSSVIMENNSVRAALTMYSLPFYQPLPLPPLLTSSFNHVCVGGGALLAVKHLSLLRFGIFSLPISFFPPIDPISCHVSSPAYPSLAQTLLHFISFLLSIPQQIPPASCLSRQT